MVKRINNLSLKWKYSFLIDFVKVLNKFDKLKTQKEKQKKTKNVYDTASEVYNDL